VVNELDKAGHMFVDEEKIIEWNPDIIFIDGGGLNLVKDDYKKNPKFYNLLKAVQDRKLYGLFPYNFYTTNIDTALANAYYIGKVIYPDEFEDINPEEKADEIYTFLVGKPVYNKMKNDWRGFGKLSLSGKSK
jgi:iron complex transport system substrate-binding protein